MSFGVTTGVVRTEPRHLRERTAPRAVTAGGVCGGGRQGVPEAQCAPPDLPGTSIAPRTRGPLPPHPLLLPAATDVPAARPPPPPRTPGINWTETPLDVALAAPYAVALLPRSVEARPPGPADTRIPSLTTPHATHEHVRP